MSEPRHNHAGDERRTPTYPLYRDACPLGCDDAVPSGRSSDAKDRNWYSVGARPVIGTASAGTAGHNPDEPCNKCGHREHEHHHSAKPRWCGATFALLDRTACPCLGFRPSQARARGRET